MMDRYAKLKAGNNLRLSDLSDVLERTREKGWAETSQGDFLGGLPARVTSAVRSAIESAGVDSVSTLDLSRLEDADVVSLVKAIRDGVESVGPPNDPGRRWPRSVPRRTFGNRFFGVVWRPVKPMAERSLRTAFVLAWEAANIAEPSRRLVLPFLLDGRISLLGKLPPSLAGARSTVLLTRRLITYHDLQLDPAAPGNDPKQLGRLLSRYEALGLIARRGRAGTADIRELGLEGAVAEYGRPQIWESVPAAAADLFARR